MSGELDWEVFEMAHEHRLCFNENHGAEFGPMTKTAALTMQARNPSGYWARQIPTPDRRPYVPPVTPAERVQGEAGEGTE